MWNPFPSHRKSAPFSSRFHLYCPSWKCLFLKVDIREDQQEQFLRCSWCYTPEMLSRDQSLVILIKALPRLKGSQSSVSGWRGKTNFHFFQKNLLVLQAFLSISRNTHCFLKREIDLTSGVSTCAWLKELGKWPKSVRCSLQNRRSLALTFSSVLLFILRRPGIFIVFKYGNIETEVTSWDLLGLIWN